MKYQLEIVDDPVRAEDLHDAAVLEYWLKTCRLFGKAVETEWHKEDLRELLEHRAIEGKGET